MEPQTECEVTTNDTIQNTSQQGSEQQGSEQPTNKEPINLEQKPDRGAGKSSQYFTLLDLRRITFTLDGEQILNAQDATNEQFVALADVVSDVTNVEQWYLEERRDFINGLLAFCEERDYPFPFTIVDEAKTPTAPLSAEKEDTGFLSNVERARPVIASNPEITSKELADALGLKSVLYAQTVKVYVNAQKGA